MSEAWGADHIPRSLGNLVEALSVAQNLPAEAIDAAVQAPGRVAEAVLAVLNRAAAGGTLTEREQNLLFWGIHVLAQVRRTDLCAPLLGLLRRPDEELEILLGDVQTATLPRVVASVFDGDRTALEVAIADPAVDGFARWSLFGAYAFLVFEGLVDAEAAKAFLIRFDEERLARGGDVAWNGWADAIALLGHADLADRVAAAWADGRLLVEEGDEAAFGETLADAVARPAERARFTRGHLGRIDDAVAVLEEMLGVHDDDAPADAPFVDPLRHVGRNDPCPCGSGRKYKKCCLGREAPAA